MNQEQTSLQNLRHSASHLLAAAVLELWRDTKPTLGPSIEDGFYYDFEFADPISENDFSKIEAKMHELLPLWKEFSRKEIPAEKALEYFKNNPYKRELIREFAQQGEIISLYECGGFTDLCRGGHCNNPSAELKYFKLLSVAGAYWRGSEKNAMLTRIYGTAFQTQKELDQYITNKEEAKKRDHKKLGKELCLFVFSDLVGPGLPLFTPKGTIIKQLLEKFVTEEKKKLGYSFVHIPHIAKAALYKKSGHLGKYDAMMPPMIDDEGESYILKPMNCPHHFEIYNAYPKSYRDLPQRYAENTVVYRNEKSGELSGLTRVKSITQDDTHHFVRHDQIQSEIEMILHLMQNIYQTFCFSDFLVQISVRDSKKLENYFGDDALWKHAEGTLIAAVKKWGAEYIIKEGEAAFYGPKIDIMAHDSIGRHWQLTTVQLDFVQPENFHLRYTGIDGKEQAPAVLHVTILGSVERFMGILIEHFAGNFPLWLAPTQIALIPVSENHFEAVKSLQNFLLQSADKLTNPLRIAIEETGDTVSAKIRRAAFQKIPYTVVIGDKEIPQNQKWSPTDSITLRVFGQKDTEISTLADFTNLLIQKIESKIAGKQNTLTIPNL
jgi:threonyl-tRNA synthetase